MSDQSAKECAGEANATVVEGARDVYIYGDVYNTATAGAASRECQDKTKPSHQVAAKSSRQESPQTSQGFDSIPRASFITRPWHVRKFKKEVNKSSSSKSDGRVADKYAKSGLSEPTFEVHPRILKVDNFFHGELATSKSFVQDYKRERLCSPSSSGLDESQMISLGELMTMITRSGEGSRVIAILGMAGSGKSTLIKRLVRDISSSNKSKWRFISNPRFELVCFLEIKDMAQMSGTVSAKDLLFSGSWFAKLEAEDISSGYEWAIKNEKKILFVLDGLDQAPWRFQESFQKVGYKEKASVEVVMANILSGTLFKDAKIVIASREHSVSQLPGELRPNTILSLMGLKFKDSEKVFDSLTSSLGAFQTLSPGIIPLCSIPLFLVFCVILHKFCPGLKPKTMSAVVDEILKSFLRSTHNKISPDKKKGKDIWAVLKSLSLDAILEMRVTFEPKEFRDRGVSPRMISAFTIKIPGHTVMNQKLFERDYKMFFSHQTLQEQFASLEIYEMKLEKFESFFRDQLHKPHLSVVKRFVCGLLSYLGDKNVENREEKWNIFKEHLRQQAEAATSSDEQLELFALLYESQDQDLIQSLVTKIDFADVVFTPATTHSLATILTSCRQLTLFRLRNCSFNEECIDILDRVTKDLQLQVDEAVIEGGCCELRKLGNFLKYLQPKFLVFILTDLTKIQEKSGWPLKEIRVDVAVFEGRFTDAWKLENFMKYLRPKVIIPLLTDLSGMQRTTSKWSLEKTTVMTFDIHSSEYCEVIYPPPFCHRTVVQDDFQGKINSMLTKFITKIKRLDVSGNYQLCHNNGFKEVGSTVAQCLVEQVVMQQCSMEGSDMKDFANGAGNTKIKRLDVSGNPMLRLNNGFKHVGSTVAQCAVEQVKMRRCLMEGSEMKDFANGAGNTKIKVLDISRNNVNPGTEPWHSREGLGERGLKEITRIVQRNEVEVLIMKRCSFKSAQLEKFKKTIPGIEFRC